MQTARPAIAHSRGNILVDAFYAAGIGGSIVALFFFVVDLFQGRPLFTPSMIGSVLFLGVPAASVRDVRLDMVAYFTLVHLAAFGVLGALISIVVHKIELHSRHPLLLGLGIFLLAEAAFLGAALFMPGVVEVLGAGRIAIANLLTAAGIALYLLWSHRPDVVRRMFRTSPQEARPVNET